MHHELSKLISVCEKFCNSGNDETKYGELLDNAQSEFNKALMAFDKGSSGDLKTFKKSPMLSIYQRLDGGFDNVSEGFERLAAVLSTLCGNIAENTKVRQRFPCESLVNSSWS